MTSASSPIKLNDDQVSFSRRWLETLRTLRGDDVIEIDVDEDPNNQSPVACAEAEGYSMESQMRALAVELQIPFCENLSSYCPAKSFLQRFEISFARQHCIFGLVDSTDELHVVVADWDGWKQLDLVARMLGRNITPLLTTSTVIQEAINQAYQEKTGQAQEMIDSLDQESVLAELDGLSSREDLLDTSGRAPVIKLVNLILFEAVKAGASDVHLQPYEDRLIVRQRIDGVLFDSFDVPKKLQEEVLSRIKVLGQMDIAEKRLPQDGRATVQVGDRLIDLRIASLPTSHNERIVIRLLDKSARLYTLAELGMRDDTFDKFSSLITFDHGLILVTGPTGSGKSTTLYAALSEINTKVQNVLTLEDPIEYQLEGVSQTQINEKKGMTFASGLKSVLRQDPDIIMVGEIRDQETAVMAIQASLTGHMVYSTLHTNDAASAVTRLLDLGIEPYLVASSLVGSLAQRLVRRICPECKYELDEANALLEIRRLQPESTAGQAFRGNGCTNCRETGYRGRLGLYELLVMDPQCRELVQQRGNASQIREAALNAGMRLLRDDGLLRALEGETTIDEVMRVARSDD